MKENEKKIIKDAILLYVKEYKKFPYDSKLLETGILAPFFKTINSDKELKKEYDALFIETLKDYVRTGTSTKMKKIFKEAFDANEELFTRFFFINSDRENLLKPEFNEVGNKIRDIVENCETQLTGTMEGGRSKYAQYSSSLGQKFKDYVKTVFPFYNSIGVTIRKVEK